MKKKTMVWAYLLILSLGTILSLYIPKNEVAAKDAIVIPGQAIRLRILANSDLESDQALKRKVRDAVNAKISVWVQDLTSIKEARKVIKSKLPEIQATAKEVVKEEGSKQSVNVKFGKVQFPTKLYGQFLYPAGNYEAILITLGAGKGANWWCVLFPPLCFLDFSNGIAVSKGFDEAHVAKADSKHSDAKTEVSSNGNTEVGLERKKEVGLDRKKEVGLERKIEDQVETVAKVEKKNSEDRVNSEDKSQAVQASAKTEVPKAKVPHVVSKPQPKSVKPDVLNRAEKEMQADEEADQYATVQAAPAKKEAPVYTSQDEEPVKVKFFVVELWKKIF